MASTTLSYPFEVREDEGGFFLLTFPDVPEAGTDGATRAEAEAGALDSLLAALGGISRGGGTCPVPPAGGGTAGPSCRRWWRPSWRSIRLCARRVSPRWRWRSASAATIKRFAACSTSITAATSAWSRTRSSSSAGGWWSASKRRPEAALQQRRYTADRRRGGRSRSGSTAASHRAAAAVLALLSPSSSRALRAFGGGKRGEAPGL